MRSEEEGAGGQEAGRLGGWEGGIQKTPAVAEAMAGRDDGRPFDSAHGKQKTEDKGQYGVSSKH